MTKEEFFQKYKIHFEDTISEMSFLMSLDNLYVQFPKEQVLQIVSDFYDNADEIFNSYKEELADNVGAILSDLAALKDSLEEREQFEEPIDKSKLC